MKGYGEKLRRLRGSKTLQKVHEDTGISRSALAMYELEERMPRDEVKIRLADYYHRSVAYIFFSKNVTNSD